MLTNLNVACLRYAAFVQGEYQLGPPFLNDVMWIRPLRGDRIVLCMALNQTHVLFWNRVKCMPCNTRVEVSSCFHHVCFIVFLDKQVKDKEPPAGSFSFTCLFHAISLCILFARFVTHSLVSAWVRYFHALRVESQWFGHSQSRT